jgi:hypothetical protein
MVQTQAGEAGLDAGEQAAPGGGLLDFGGGHGLGKGAGAWRCGSGNRKGVVQPQRAGRTSSKSEARHKRQGSRLVRALGASRFGRRIRR